MSLAMVEQRCRILVTHAKECHGSMDVRVLGAHNVACGYVDDVLTLICKKGFYEAVMNAKWRPPRKEDSILQEG